MRTDSVVVVLSGGQDSTTVLFLAKQRFDKVHAITFDYGQRHRLEIDCAVKVAKMAEVDSHEIIDVIGVMHSVSPLVSDTDLEKYSDAKQMDSIIGTRRELTFVPMRNMLFLNIAANRAEELRAGVIATGVCEMDNANYPDCRQNFISATETAMNLALGSDLGQSAPLEIWTPLIYLGKASTVILSFNTPGCWEALAYSHTSYDGKYPPTDMNHSNVLRADGFEKAGLPDPLVLRAFNEGIMSLPKTANYSVGALKKADHYVR